MQFSKFAKQIGSDAGIINLMEDLGTAMCTSEKSYMLGGGNPSDIPEARAFFQQEMRDICDDKTKFGSMVGNYDGPQGNADFLRLLSHFFNQQYGWNISSEHIAITNGSQASFGLLFNLLGGEFANGSFKQILLPLTPEYIGYADVGLSDQALFKANKPLIEKIGDDTFKYHVDFDALKVDSNIGALCVSRPTNPTGNVISDDELAKLSKLAKSSGIPLIIDGAYGVPFPNIIFSQATPSWQAHHILCFSLSKLGLPGVRTGIVVANPKLIEQIRNANAIFSLAPGSVGPALLSRAVKSGDILTLSEQIIKPYYLKRRDEAIMHIKQQMPDLPVRVHQPEGAIFLWLWFEGLPISSQTLYQRLKKRHVLVIAGQHFFPGLDEAWQHKNECIRITYSSDESSVKKGIEIIAEVAREAYNMAELT